MNLSKTVEWPGIVVEEDINGQSGMPASAVAFMARVIEDGRFISDGRIIGTQAVAEQLGLELDIESINSIDADWDVARKAGQLYLVRKLNDSAVGCSGIEGAPPTAIADPFIGVGITVIIGATIVVTIAVDILIDHHLDPDETPIIHDKSNKFCNKL